MAAAVKGPASEHVTVLSEVANPAAVGWEWTDSRTGTAYQVAWIRDSHRLLLGMRRSGVDAWTMTSMDADRWRVDGSLPDARLAAREFYELGAADHPED